VEAKMKFLDLFWLTTKDAKEAFDKISKGPNLYCFNRYTDRRIWFRKGCDFVKGSGIDVEIDINTGLIVFKDNSIRPEANIFTKSKSGGSITHYPLFDILHIIVGEPKRFKSLKGTFFEIGIGLRHFVLVDPINGVIK